MCCSCGMDNYAGNADMCIASACHIIDKSNEASQPVNAFPHKTSTVAKTAVTCTGSGKELPFSPLDLAKTQANGKATS